MNRFDKINIPFKLLLSVFLLLVTIFSMTACDNSDDSDKSSDIRLGSSNSVGQETNSDESFFDKVRSFFGAESESTESNYDDSNDSSENGGFLSSAFSTLKNIVKGIFAVMIIIIILFIVVIVVCRKKAKNFSLSGFMRKKRKALEKQNAEYRNARKEAVKMAADNLITHNNVTAAKDVIDAAVEYTKDKTNHNKVNFDDMNANELDMFRKN